MEGDIRVSEFVGLSVPSLCGRRAVGRQPKADGSVACALSQRFPVASSRSFSRRPETCLRALFLLQAK